MNEELRTILFDGESVALLVKLAASNVKTKRPTE